jgi:hypothetical protein
LCRPGTSARPIFTQMPNECALHRRWNVWHAPLMVRESGACHFSCRKSGAIRGFVPKTGEKWHDFPLAAGCPPDRSGHILPAGGYKGESGYLHLAPWGPGRGKSPRSWSIFDKMARIQPADGWSMGWVRGRAARKPPSPVSMKWSGVQGAGTPPGHGGFGGAWQLS